MARVFVTGSTDGLGLGVARQLIAEGHDVVCHARNPDRASVLGDLTGRAAGVVVGDLSSQRETVELAAQVNSYGVMDAVIHNAGIGDREPRAGTPDGRSRLLAINVLAPYLLTALVERPARLVYLTSGMHLHGTPSVDDLDWAGRPWDGPQAYSDSKLFDTTLAFAVARLWPGTLSNAVDPGWVATKMGGPSATDDFTLGHVTQAWLAVSDDPSARVTGRYFHHRQPRDPHPASRDVAFQAKLLAALQSLTAVGLPA
jgi:NAD(P)-dependent dehydrogenase (short-subunit alcohol dehydrogenase family)